MRHRLFEGTIALRVDVDFPLGLRRGVPRLLDELARHGMQATFFVVAGSNRPHRSLRRVTQADWRRRMRRLGPGRILRALGASLGGRGRLLDGAEARAVLRRIVDEGHELAAHGHDHAWWIEHATAATAGELRVEIARAFDALQDASGEEVRAFGAPGWRTTGAALRILADRGVPYLADCWGEGPFLTVDDAGATIAPPHLPITLPSLESLILDSGLEPAVAVRAVLDGRPADRFDLACLHDYFEGLMHPDLGRGFLEACARAGLRTVGLAEAASRVTRSGFELPRCALGLRPVPGFAGDACWQGAPLRSAVPAAVR